MKKNAQLRQKDIPELKKDVKNLRKKLVNLKFERETGSLKKVHQIKQNKRELARLVTILSEKEKETKK
jgi:large subunit ribosomal protein L29